MSSDKSFQLCDVCVLIEGSMSSEKSLQLQEIYMSIGGGGVNEL